MFDHYEGQADAWVDAFLPEFLVDLIKVLDLESR